jgi:hypothetical protein
LDVDATIEHILPENPAEDWYRIFDVDNIETAVYRLGNLTLLEEKLNKRDAANKPFEQKKGIYGGSQFCITADLAKLELWNMEAIRKRQKKFADLAATVWKANY